MNFFVLLSVVKKLCKTILYTHIVELFPFLVPTRIKENYKTNKQFFLLAIRAQQKDSKIFSPTYLINIQPSCSLMNGFSASNQTLHTQKRPNPPEIKRVPERKYREIVCVHAKAKESKSLLPYL